MALTPASSARCSRSLHPLRQGLRWPRVLGCVLAALIGPAAGAAPAVAAGQAQPPLPGLLADHRIYVDREASGSGDGSSWQNAYPRLQDALARARTLAPAESVEVWVAEGVYYPSLGAGLSASDRTRAFQLANNVAIFGGFAGTETAAEQRDPAAHVTVLSGDIDRNDVVDAAGVTLQHEHIVGNNSYQVVRANGVDASAVLSGFTVTGGLANGGGLIESTYLMRRGAGLYLYSSAPRLSRLEIRGNLAEWASDGRGAAIYGEAPSGTVVAPYIEHSRILHNRALSGGAFYGFRSNLRAHGVQFLNNTAVNGGAAYLNLTSNVSFMNCVFAGNTATGNGGAIYGFREFLAIANSLMTGNYAGIDGGAYYAATTHGLNVPVVLTNTTVSGNRAGNLGGALFRNASDAGVTLLFNAILWNNQDSTGIGTASSVFAGPGASRLTASHSLVQGMLAPGTANLDGRLSENTPNFLAPLAPAAAPSTAGDFHLQSPYVGSDLGNNQARINYAYGNNVTPIPLQGNVDFDLDGRPRIVDGDIDGTATVDLGPYEGVAYSIGGTVTGLEGSSLVLRNNGVDDLAISANGEFRFSRIAADQETYAVTVATQPQAPRQTCSVTAGTGTVDAASVNDVVVSCVTNRVTVTPSAGAGGQISPNTPQTVAEMSRVEFTLSPSPGYAIGPVAGSCAGSLSGTVFTTEPVETDCTVHASFVPQTTTSVGASINPARRDQAVEFVVDVLGVGAAPTGGQVQVNADSGESCSDSAGPEIIGNSARFRCSISFSSLGDRQVTAAFTGSNSHTSSISPSIGMGIKRFADVSVNMDDGRTQAVPGEPASYLVELRNLGPDEASNTRLLLIADPELDGPNWLCSPVGTAVCPEADGSGELSLTVDLPAGSGLDLVQDGSWPALLPNEVSVRVQATVSGVSPDQVLDPVPGNNTAVDLNAVDGIFADGFETDTQAARAD